MAAFIYSCILFLLLRVGKCKLNLRTRGVSSR